MKKHLFTLVFSFVSLIAFGQTNVSGGIYSNTTWTQANSPYIVTDSIVVFPGVTLTIEPGVVVKFDSAKYMEVRQANIFAEGTITDSITFTSNAVVPAPGKFTFWLNNYPAHTVSKFNYCNFQYGTNGLYAYGVFDTLTIRNSSFTYNTNGMEPGGGYVLIDSCNISNNLNIGIYKLHSILDHCTISNNQTGVYARSGAIHNCLIEHNQTGVFGGAFSIFTSEINYNQTGIETDDGNIIINHCIIDSNNVKGISLSFSSTIVDSEIKYNNGIGIETDGQGSHIIRCDIENNITGIKEDSQNDNIYCNKICNNTTYDFNYSNTSAGNFSIPNNYWCSNDSAVIASHIYDGYDNINLGLISFLPMDTLQCYLSIGVSFISKEKSTFGIYPNPTTNRFTIKNISSVKGTLMQIINPVGEVFYTEMLFGQDDYVVNANLSHGIYFVRVSDGEKKGVMKLIVE